ncbi:alpha-humulene 10-hydroxylase-like [Curcuma longa]|uniref:alpha-humulene 10-hydroxylase-like n=1 Tax=Curcuma longa TaxID=136217 RepID=UPI003D9DDF64
MAMEANSLFSPFFFITLFLGFFITILIMRSRSRVHKQRAQVVLAPLPPGPPRLPLIGNIHQLVGDNPHRILLQLARTHGPLVCLRLGQVYQVVASSVEAVEEIIKRHDLKFADRPTDLTFSKILDYDGNGVAMVPYGGKWKQGRKIYAMEMLNSRRVKSYATIRVDAVRKLTAEIARKAFAETPVINLSEMAMSMINAKLEGVRGKLDKVFDEIIAQRQVALAAQPTEEDLIIDVLLKLKDEENQEFPITSNDVKAIIMGSSYAHSSPPPPPSALRPNLDCVASSHRRLRPPPSALRPKLDCVASRLLATDGYLVAGYKPTLLFEPLFLFYNSP